jgi:DNA repair protein SbcC/Rad50
MRILSVEAQNLTSLPEFSVHFDESPLREAGIFAITGPTGAGKSSILDAICLALYNSTPRTEDDGRVWTGTQGELSSKDPAGLMRRGTAKVSIKLRFLGRDRQVYRSEWEVRRAREKVEGKLQEPTLRLYDERSGRLISGGTTRETLALIVDKVGLSFDQFRRAVLLAQGDFAAFLKAGYDERSLLLEKLTGQVLYTHVSRLAFERSRDATRALDALLKEREECQVLEPDARRSLEELLAGEQEQLALLEQRQEQAATTQRWVQEEKQRLLRLHNAELALVAVQQEWPELESLEAEIRSVEAAEDCREPLRRVEEAARGLAKLRERREKEEIALKKETESVLGLEALVQRAQERCRAAAARAAELEPALKEARRLDGALIDAEANHRNAATRHRELGIAVQQAHKELAATQQRRQDSEAREAEVARWLQEQQLWEQRAVDSSLWEKLLEDAGSMLRRSKELAGALAELEPRRKGLLQRLSDAQQAHQEARTRLQKREEALVEAESHCVDPAPLRAQQGAMQAGLDALVGLQRQVEEGLRLKQQEDEEEARRTKIEGEVADAALQRERLQAELELLRPRVEQARADRDQAVAFEELAARRAALRPGEPCVLCGAVEHPWAHRPLEQLSQDLRSEYAALELQQQRLQRELTTQDTLEKQGRRLWEPLVQGLAQLRGRRDVLRSKLQLDLSAWKTSQNLAELPPAPDLAGRLKAAEEQLRGRFRGLAQQLDQADRAEKAAAQARLQRAAAATAAESSRVAEDAAQKAVDQATVQWERLGSDQAQLQRELEEIRLRLPTDLRGEDALALLRRGVAVWKERQTAHQGLQAELLRLESQLQAQLGHLAEREQTLAQARGNLELCEKVLAGLRVERAGFLEGRPADIVEKEAQADQKSADEALNLTQNRLSGARAALHAVTEALAATRIEEADAVVQHEAGLAALQYVLAGRAEAEIRRILAHDGRWIQESRSRIAAWRERAATARGEKATCQRLVEEHRQHAPPLDPVVAQQHLADGPQQRALRQEQIQSIQASLRRDSDQQDRLEKLLPQLTIADLDARKWAELSDLIGSSDGQKFRAFAQGLTLEVLIGAANRNLGLLNDRYRLAKAPNPKNEPKGDMNLQVIDRYMGDEIRPISSLSGGELFLTSLALALALADLASHRSTRVETVFIDEGFGSLDTRTLDMALSALEALSDEGRQVGIVSHVAGLHERIGVQVQVRKIDAVKGSEVRVVRR